MRRYFQCFADAKQRVQRNRFIDIDRLNLAQKGRSHSHNLRQLLLCQPLQLAIISHFQTDHLVIFLEFVLRNNPPYYIIIGACAGEYYLIYLQYRLPYE